MIRREPFHQVLTGSYLRPGESGGGLPATLELHGTRPLLVPGLGRSLSVQGVLDATGLLDRRPVQGRVTFDRLVPFAVSYDLAVTLDDGTRGRLHGTRASDLRGLLTAASSVRAELVDPLGRCIATFVLRFDYRRDLLRYLT